MPVDENNPNEQQQAARQAQPVGFQPGQQPGFGQAPQMGPQPGQQFAPGPGPQGFAGYRQPYVQPGNQPYVGAQPQYHQPVAPPAPTSEKKSMGWVVAIVFIVCLFLFTGFCVKSCSDAVRLFGGSSKVALSKDTIALINLDGTIQYDGSACSPEGLKDLLDQAESDSHIKGVVIRVNSGGGTATAGEEMAEYLKEFSKPVVVSSASVNASAAYMISAQADYIYVAHSTEIGAIGTAIQLSDISGLLDMLGIDMEVITSSSSKDSSYGYRALTEEERAYYQDMVDKINGMFIRNVMEGRNMTESQVKSLATGLAFTGDDAVANGLADAVGTREDALDKAAALAGASKYDVIELSLDSYDLSSLYSLLGSSQDKSDALEKLTDLARREGLL